jgi:hypothetical protein
MRVALLLVIVLAACSEDGKPNGCPTGVWTLTMTQTSGACVSPQLVPVVLLVSKDDEGYNVTGGDAVNTVSFSGIGTIGGSCSVSVTVDQEAPSYVGQLQLDLETPSATSVTGTGDAQLTINEAGPCSAQVSVTGTVD